MSTVQESYEVYWLVGVQVASPDGNTSTPLSQCRLVASQLASAVGTVNAKEPVISEQ
jgi:hypothetical protein